jgi:hypothetical protein
MQLVLIGMSGVGKSTWARRLSSCGLRAFHCDEAIAARIAVELGSTQPLTDANLGAWLGLPDEPGYAEREAWYLRHETAVLHEAAELLGAGAFPWVIDTSGSAIYCGVAPFARLRARARIVYLPVRPGDHGAMLEAYLRSPRPVVWNGLFQPQADEARQHTYRRCFPALIRQREGLYEAHCDTRIPPETHRQADLAPEAFLALARG